MIVLKVGQLSRSFDKMAVFSLFIGATGKKVFQTHLIFAYCVSSGHNEQLFHERTLYMR